MLAGSVAWAATRGTTDRLRGSAGPLGMMVPNTCEPAKLPGTVVRVRLMGMDAATGHGMMGDGGMLGGEMMHLVADRSVVRAGRVSLVAQNVGGSVHELVVLPLGRGQSAGQRVVGGDNRVSEAGSLGEASRSCGAGAGEGIAPGTSGWVTLNLKPGRYELVCNLPGHYRAGMHAELRVK